MDYDRLLDDTLKNLSRGKKIHRGEERIPEHLGARYTTDGMKLAKALAVAAFYNATCDRIPRKELRKSFEEFYENLDRSIDSIGKTGNFSEEKDTLFGRLVDVLRLLGIPREKWRNYV